jgi:putative DNA primase/helicase
LSEIVHLEDYAPGDGGGGDKRPVVRVTAGEIGRARDEIDKALKDGCSGLYQQGGRIVHVALTPAAAADGRQTQVIRLIDSGPAHIGAAMTRCARIEKYDGRKNEWVASHAPSLLIDTYLQRRQWSLPWLRGVIAAPTMLPDGTVLQRPGYDSASGFMLWAEIKFPLVADRPPKEDGAAAARFLMAPFETFDFVGPVDRSVFLAALLSSVARCAFDAAPMTIVTSPVAGSGKTTLADGVAITATGRRAAVLAQGHTDEEFEKRLQGPILAGERFLCIDNVERVLDSPLLCQVITQPEVKVRRLGTSDAVDVPTGLTIFATGNNLTLRGDLTRRSLSCRLDPLTDRPELREFASNPLDIIAADRGKYVAAALTVLRAHQVSGHRSSKPPVGSFEGWSRIIRDALLWLGEADPCDAFEQLRSRDPKLEALTVMLDEWEKAIGEEPMQLSRVIDRAIDTAMGEFRHPDLREALLTVAGDKGIINPVRLGKWMSVNAERIVGGRRFVKDSVRVGIARWKLELVER